MRSLKELLSFLRALAAIFGTALVITFMIAIVQVLLERASSPSALDMYKDPYLLACPGVSAVARVFDPKPEGDYLWVRKSPNEKRQLIGPGCTIVSDVR